MNLEPVVLGSAPQPQPLSSVRRHRGPLRPPAPRSGPGQQRPLVRHGRPAGKGRPGRKVRCSRRVGCAFWVSVPAPRGHMRMWTGHGWKSPSASSVSCRHRRFSPATAKHPVTKTSGSLRRPNGTETQPCPAWGGRICDVDVSLTWAVSAGDEIPRRWRRGQYRVLEEERKVLHKK